jgi:site-specific DNA recombinase
MNKDTFQKFHAKYAEERSKIMEELQDCALTISNLSESLNQALNLSAKLNTVWASSDIKLREKLQKLIFPEGIYYDLKTGSFRTEKVNSIFMQMLASQPILRTQKKGQTLFLIVCPL